MISTKVLLPTAQAAGLGSQLINLHVLHCVQKTFHTIPLVSINWLNLYKQVWEEAPTAFLAASLACLHSLLVWLEENPVDFIFIFLSLPQFENSIYDFPSFPLR